MQRRKRTERTPTSAGLRSESASTLKRRSRRSASRRERYENQIIDFRKQLLAVLAKAIRKTMKDIQGNQIAKISNYTPSQISMMSNGEEYFEKFSTETILSMMLNFYNIKLILGDYCGLEKDGTHEINIHLMSSPD